MPQANKKQPATDAKNGMRSQAQAQAKTNTKPARTPRPSQAEQVRAKPKPTLSKADQLSFLPKSDDPDFINLFRSLNEATPRDSNGFLTAFYDPTQIPHDLNQRPPDKREKHLLAARIPLSMMEGYHSLPDTKPVWTQLPSEPKAYFEAFRAFLLSPSRSLALSGNDIDFEVPGFTPYTLREAYTLFYWADRSRSYDILKPVAAARNREQRLLLSEDAHYLLTQKLLTQFEQEIHERAGDSDNDRPWEGLKASELISGISSMIQMQRVSLGLPSHGPKLKNEGFQPASHAGTERSIRESSQNYMGTHEAGLTLAQKMQQDINRTLAEDPNAAAELQAAALSILLRTRQQQPIQIDATQAGYGPPHKDAE